MLALLVALILAAIPVFAAEMTLFGAGAGETAFGTADFSVGFDVSTGRMVSLTLDGQPLLSGNSDESWIIEEEKRVTSSSCAPPRIEQMSDDTVCVQQKNADWQVESYYRLDLNHLRMRRWFRLSRLGAADTKIHSFRVANGCMPVKGNGGYRVLMEYPMKFRRSADFVRGCRRRPRYSPSVVLASNGGGLSLLWTLDELVSYADAADNEVVEDDGAFRVETVYRTAGHVRGGDVLTIGDSWLLFCRGDVDELLTRIRPWRNDLGMKPPVDRPDWASRMIIYCIHPGGTIGSCCRDWGGFPAATKYLDEIRRMGINTVWLMPLEDFDKSGEGWETGIWGT